MILLRMRKMMRKMLWKTKISPESPVLMFFRFFRRSLSSHMIKYSLSMYFRLDYYVVDIKLNYELVAILSINSNLKVIF